MLGQVQDPHVVTLYRLVESERGTAIIMEVADGVPLKAILAEYGALEPEAALSILKGSLLGLAAAHTVGVVHGCTGPRCGFILRDWTIVRSKDRVQQDLPLRLDADGTYRTPDTGSRLELKPTQNWSVLLDREGERGSAGVAGFEFAPGLV